jgi:hypothetical protein
VITTLDATHGFHLVIVLPGHTQHISAFSHILLTDNMMAHAARHDKNTEELVIYGDIRIEAITRQPALRTHIFRTWLLREAFEGIATTLVGERRGVCWN